MQKTPMCMGSQRALKKVSRKCCVEGCNKPRGSSGWKGMCGKCYRQSRQAAQAESEQKPRGRASKTCRAVFASGKKCNRPVVSKAVGLCRAHAASADVERIFDMHYNAEFVIPEREPWSFEGREEELAEEYGSGSTA
jgi:hypothetical protein